MQSEEPNILNRLLPSVLALALIISASFHVPGGPMPDQKTDDQQEPASPTETLSVAPATISVIQIILDTDFPLLQTIERSEEACAKLTYDQRKSGRPLKYLHVLFRLIISPNAP